LDIVVETAADLQSLMANLQGTFDFVAILGSVGALADAGRGVVGLGALHGSTSCRGAMTHHGTTEGVACFAIRDPDGSYGVALRAFEDDPESAARAATVAALSAADRIGEAPDLVWVSATPGCEEAVLAGIEAVVGRDVPIIGGSAADDDVSGNWFVFDQDAITRDGVVVSVLFPSAPVSFAYQNGYSPTPHRGIISRAEGRRLQEIDGQPALEVYRAWTENAIDAPTGEAESLNILAASTLWPLGREITQLENVPFYLLAHPAVAHADGAIDLFATVAVGEEITLMTGTTEGLASRAGRVAALARAAGRFDDKPMSGALMIYCGGCMLAVQDRLDEIVGGVNTALDGAPFLGAFTFGEQGALIRAGNRHGNLMISCIVFG
jgi:hypothetical protein